MCGTEGVHIAPRATQWPRYVRCAAVESGGGSADGMAVWQMRISGRRPPRGVVVTSTPQSVS
eukprot:scaffold100_cov357-Prasinococcus_capsulatus_cf.AAC.24